ncbi:MAG: hypothetical protein RLY93_04150 [Sumerlaeia bacterium]
MFFPRPILHLSLATCLLAPVAFAAPIASDNGPWALPPRFVETTHAGGLVPDEPADSTASEDRAATAVIEVQCTQPARLLRLTRLAVESEAGFVELSPTQPVARADRDYQLLALELSAPEESIPMILDTVETIALTQLRETYGEDWQPAFSSTSTYRAVAVREIRLLPAESGQSADPASGSVLQTSGGTDLAAAEHDQLEAFTISVPIHFEYSADVPELVDPSQIAMERSWTW